MWQGISQLRFRGTEISHSLGGGRNLLARKHHPALFITPFFVPEEEDPVFLDWSAEVEAIVVIFQLRFWLTIRVKKKVGSVQFITPIKLEAATVKLVAAAFRNEIDYRSLRLTIFRTEAITLY